MADSLTRRAIQPRKMNMAKLSQAELTFVEWVRRKHADNAPQFRDKLVEGCESEFFNAKVRTEDERAKTYMNVRLALEKPHLDQLRRHESICCCS